MLAFLLFAATIALAPRLKTDFLGSMGASTLRVVQEMPSGTSLAQTDAASKRAGFDATRYEMSAAVLAALKSTSASQRRWRDGKLAFPNVLDKSSV